MTPLLWGIALLLIAAGIIVLEMFVPSAGMLAICAGVTAIVAIVIVFVYEGVMTGALFFLASCILLGITAAGAIRWWPHTSIGRLVLNLPPGEEEEIASPPDYGPLQRLIGQYGMAVSKMVPGGVITISGKSYDAISKAGVIEEGTPVVVISVDGTRILVREDSRVAAMNESPVEDTNVDPTNVDPTGPVDKSSGDTSDAPAAADAPNNPFEDPLV